MFPYVYYYEKSSVSQFRTIMEIDQTAASNIQEYLFTI
jgi:hypothetical protein